MNGREIGTRYIHLPICQPFPLLLCYYQYTSSWRLYLPKGSVGLNTLSHILLFLSKYCHVTQFSEKSSSILNIYSSLLHGRFSKRADNIRNQNAKYPQNSAKNRFLQLLYRLLNGAPPALVCKGPAGSCPQLLHSKFQQGWQLMQNFYLASIWTM